MHRIVLLSSFGFLLLASAVVARAETPATTLAAGARAEYRFDYRGDGTPIKIALDTANVDSVVMVIYTPEQLAAMARGKNPAPVGRGTPGREAALFWSGAFKAGGVYRVFVENRAPYPITYRISITGEGVSGVARVDVDTIKPPSAARLVEHKGRKILSVSLPPGIITSTLSLVRPPEPSMCTRAHQVPPMITRSLKLCSGEIYPPLWIVGNNIALFADAARSAIVTSAGRQFAITVEGSNNWIEGVTIQARADARDLNAWMCLYDECVFATRPVPTILHGGIRYGGGILLKGSNSTIYGVTVRGGTIGIATVGGRANYVIENQLSELNGWGSFNIGSGNSYFVGNVLNRNNHGCTTPDGNKFQYGCGTAGWVCLGCTANVIAQNYCELSANCYYLSGKRGLASNENKFLANYCLGAPNNCFEITFSLDNLLRDNVAAVEPKSDMPCNYPFWIGGSVVFFQGNTWQCKIGEDEAFEQSRDSTVAGTNIIHMETYTPFPKVTEWTYMPGLAVPPAIIVTRWGLAITAE